MTPRPDLVALPVDEKLNLIEQLWDSLAKEEKDSLPVPDWHRDELQKREAEIAENPSGGISWDELKRQLFTSK